MAEDQQPIRFQLNESIWLDHNARSAEIIRLALDPEIEVHEDEDLVNVRGHLVLSGRFDTSDQENKEEALDLESSSIAEQLQFQPLSVEQKEIYQKHYKGQIQKRFPVDVTVPRHKVRDRNQVFVQVEHFDYELEGSHHLRVEADVTVRGIELIPREDIIVEKKSGGFRSDHYYPAFDVAAASDERQGSEQPNTQDGEHGTEETLSGDERHIGQSEDTEENRSAENEEDKIDASQEYSDGETNGDRQDEQEQPVQQFQADEMRTTSDENGENEGHSELQALREAGADGSELEEDGEAPEKRDEQEVGEERDIKTSFQALPEPPDDSGEENETQGSKTSAFLAQLMSDKENEHEQSYTRLKMCIVQKDETLEAIAERYELHVTDIMRVNQLRTQEVSTGQIIYIPK